MKLLLLTAWLYVSIASLSIGAVARPIKDLTDVEHDRQNVITGFGLVVGLNGTGGTVARTREALVNIRQRFGMPVDPIIRAGLRNDNKMLTNSMSLVLVSAKLNTTDQIDAKIRVSVAAADDATDLNNGILVATPLVGFDRQVYAVASGRVTTGGILAAGAAATVQKNHPTTGTSEAVVEKRVPNCYEQRGFTRLLLRNPDYETATRIREVINARFPHAAKIDEPGIVRVTIPPRFYNDRFKFISLIQRERVVPNSKARVVINSQTGTVVVSETVTISKAAVTHGNISVITGETPLVSQPLPLSRGETVVVPRTDIDVVEQTSPMTVIGETATVTELAETLNALGVSPQDLSSIFQQLHSANVLHAELVIE